jgi:hypothetical protein
VEEQGSRSFQMSALFNPLIIKLLIASIDCFSAFVNHPFMLRYYTTNQVTAPHNRTSPALHYNFVIGQQAFKPQERSTEDSKKPAKVHCHGADQ